MQESLVQARACAGSGGASSKDTARQEMRMCELRHQLDFQRGSNTEAEKMCWAKELEAKKKQDRLEILAKGYNSGLEMLAALDAAEAAASLRQG